MLTIQQSKFGPGTCVNRSLTLIGYRISLSRFTGRGLHGEKDQVFYSLHSHLLCILTFPYRTYSIIHSVLSCIFLKYTIGVAQTQKCQPNNVTISVFASIMC